MHAHDGKAVMACALACRLRNSAATWPGPPTRILLVSRGRRSDTGRRGFRGFLQSDRVTTRHLLSSSSRPSLAPTSEIAEPDCLRPAGDREPPPPVPRRLSWQEIVAATDAQNPAHEQDGAQKQAAADDGQADGQHVDRFRAQDLVRDGVLVLRRGLCHVDVGGHAVAPDAHVFVGVSSAAAEARECRVSLSLRCQARTRADCYLKT